jgi:polysaccharide biosynthesis protein PslH
VKILWACPFFPYPPDNGTRIREYFLMRELSNWNEVSVFSLVQSRKELENTGDLGQFCRNVWGILPGNKLPDAFFDGKRQAVDVVAGIFRPHPQHFYGRPSPNVVQELRRHIEEEKFDIVVIEHLLMSNYVWNILGKPGGPLWVLSQENVESLIQKQHISLARNGLERLRKVVYYRSFIQFEGHACQRYDRVFMVSENDRQELLKLAPTLPADKVSLLPNGVDVSNYDIGEVEPQENTLIYIGAMTYNANYDAMQFFLRDIFPIIQRQMPEVKVKITGKTQGVDLSGLALNEQVEFTGYIEDIRPGIKSSSICIVPLQVGGGTRLKILEAMALGTPVVATSKGAEGLNMQPGQDLLVADAPEDFAREVVRLLRQPELREELRQNGRKAVERQYDSHHIAADLNQVFESMIERRRQVH